MKLNNGSMIYKKVILEFIYKKRMILLYSLLLILIVPISFLMFKYFDEMPIFIKISGPFMLVVIILGFILLPFNGMIIFPNGTILFFPDFRIKKYHVNDLERIEIVFIKSENNKYFALIKIINKKGKTFLKDYSNQIKITKHKKMARAVYTIDKDNVNKIRKKIGNISFIDFRVVE